MRLGHMAVHPGKRVLVILRNGERIEDRFVTRTDRDVVLELAGRIPVRRIRSLSPWRENLTADRQAPT